MSDDGMMAQTITVTGHQGDEIEAYHARPLGGGPYPGVVLIHHIMGLDRSSKELVRTFAVYGYNAVSPNLFHRYAPGAKSADAAAAAREAGGVSDEQCLGDVQGAVDHLRALPTANGKVGVIGYCSGGRQAYLVACSLEVDAVVDCYGGRAPVELTPQMRSPLLGLFGAEDSNPSPADVAALQEALEANGKTYEIHSYAGAGHAFFAVDRPNYNLDAARDGWKQIWAWFGQHLATS